MIDAISARRDRFVATLVGCLAVAGSAVAQTTPAPAAPTASPAASTTASPASTASAFGAPDPSPYYLGASQALTHDSNVYRIPGGPSDTYSSTSLLAGFDQRISRQRVFGRATVSANRYLSEDRLNNVSYNLGAGLDWQTIENISGNVNAGLSRSLAAPAATSTSPTTEQRNTVQTQTVDARARWGGPGLLTLEGGLNYAKIDYSGSQNATADSSQRGASLGLHYRPGGPLRLGVAARVNRTHTPNGLLDPATGAYISNTRTAKHLDFLVDYQLSGLLATSGRLSYTRQSNSAIDGADFSGLTGSLKLNWQATGKTSVGLDVARDAGFDISRYSGYTIVLSGLTTEITPVSGTYENNRVTDSLGLRVAYAATGKINATAGLRYARAKLLTTNISASGAQSSLERTDVLKVASLGANYAATRNVSAACNVSRESRKVSGGRSISYSANTIGCSAQFLWR